MGPENYGFFPLHLLPIFWPPYSLFIRRNYINIDKNKKKKLGSFFTLFINFNPRAGASPLIRLVF